MFYMLLALALKYNYKTSKHQQLIGWFNQNFIKTGKIDVAFGKIVNDAFENRSDSDYGVFVEYTDQDVVTMTKDLNSFIIELERIIKEQPS